QRYGNSERRAHPHSSRDDYRRSADRRRRSWHSLRRGNRDGTRRRCSFDEYRNRQRARSSAHGSGDEACCSSGAATLSPRTHAEEVVRNSELAAGRRSAVSPSKMPLVTDTTSSDGYVRNRAGETVNGVKWFDGSPMSARTHFPFFFWTAKKLSGG